MDDLFGVEQQIYDSALEYFESLKDGEAVDKARLGTMIKEYGSLLKQLRRTTKISDRTTSTLNTGKQSLLEKVHIDALTGIYNRWFLDENMPRIIKSLARSGGTVSVMMVDIDCFKKYNDTYGHPEGDSCLKAVVGAIAKTLLRPDDFVARYGGEEFAIVLVNTDESGARYIAGKILRNVRALQIPHKNSEAAECVTVSIGATTGKPESDHNADDYIKQADKALYQSKQNGRNRYTFIDFTD